MHYNMNRVRTYYLWYKYNAYFLADNCTYDGDKYAVILRCLTKGCRPHYLAGTKIHIEAETRDKSIVLTTTDYNDIIGYLAMDEL